MAESKLRNMSMDFSMDIINLVKYLKSNHETIIASQIGRTTQITKGHRFGVLLLWLRRRALSSTTSGYYD